MVPIYYERRIAKLGLNANELPKPDTAYRHEPQDDHGRMTTVTTVGTAAVGPSIPSVSRLPWRIPSISRHNSPQMAKCSKSSFVAILLAKAA